MCHEMDKQYPLSDIHFLPFLRFQHLYHFTEAMSKSAKCYFIELSNINRIFIHGVQYINFHIGNFLS